MPSISNCAHDAIVGNLNVSEKSATVGIRYIYANVSYLQSYHYSE